MEEEGSSIMGTIKAARSQSPLLFYTLMAFALSIVLFLLIGAITSWQSIFDVMFRDKNDIFMDYFNSIYYSWTGKPYTEFTIIYPPLITAIYGLIATFINVEIGITDGFGIRETYVGLFSYMIFVLIAIMILHTILKNVLKNQKQQILVDLLIVCILLSYPVVFAIMRGNSILYSAVFVSLYIVGYRSNNKVIRYGAYICLGIATGIKIFPAFLWILSLRRRDYAESFKAFFIIIILLFVPFVFTDGTPGFLITFAFNYTSGVSTISEICNTRDLIYIFTHIGVPDLVLKIVSTLLIAVQYLSVLVVLLNHKGTKHWEIITLCVLAMCLGFGTSAAYMPIYLVLCVALFLSEERDATRFNYTVIVLLFASLVVLPGFGGELGRHIMVSIHGLAMIGLYYLLLWKVISRNKKNVD